MKTLRPADPTCTRLCYRNDACDYLQLRRGRTAAFLAKEAAHWRQVITAADIKLE